MVKRRDERTEYLPSAEEIQAELAKVEELGDFFGKEGIFARLFGRTVEAMLEAELSEELGYGKYEAKGRNSGNSRNGKRKVTLETSAGSKEVKVPRDRNGEFKPKLLEEKRTNELEKKITVMYSKGMSTGDIAETVNVAKAQKNFIDFLILPSFTALS